MKSYTFHNKSRQMGAATLFAVLVLLVVMATLTLTTTRSGMMEQQIVGNDIRAREAQEAAEAGLEYGLAWGTDNTIMSSMTCTSANETDCPTFAQVTGSTSSEAYNYTLTFTKGADSIKVVSVSQGATDSSISATSEAFIKQIPVSLFGSGMSMPPPWVIAGCLTTSPTGTPDTFVLNATNNAVVSGTDASSACLNAGHLDVHEWNDDDGDGIKVDSEVVATTTFNTDTFSGCPSTNCSWNAFFDMSLADAKQAAIDSGHVYTTIPCGAATSSPSIYIINNSGPINGADISGSCSGPGLDGATVGAPNQPIVLIIPSASNCPKFNGGVTIYGVVYYESETECAANGWGGATIYGSVMWEGDVNKPNANSAFIEVDYGSGTDLNNTFNTGIDDAIRIPGTWKDF